MKVVIVLSLVSCLLKDCIAEVGRNGSHLRDNPRETYEKQDRDLILTRPIKDSFSNRHVRKTHFKERAATSIRRLDGSTYYDPYYEGQKPYDDDDEYYINKYYDDAEVLLDDKYYGMYYEGQVDEKTMSQETSENSPKERNSRSSKIVLGVFLFAAIAAALVALGWKILKHRNKKNVTNATEIEVQGQASESEII